MAKFYQAEDGKLFIITDMPPGDGQYAPEYAGGATIWKDGSIAWSSSRIPVKDFTQAQEMILVPAEFVRARTGVLDRMEVARRLKDQMVDPANFTTPEDLHTCAVQTDVIRGVAHALGVLEEFDALIQQEGK